MFKEIVDRLLAFPQRGQIKVDFDLKKKIFHLSIPIFSSFPQSVKNYVEARKNRTFKPNVTSFQIEGSRVVLSQEVSFDADFQSTLRKQVDDFWQLSKHCHRMFAEIAVEERYKTALHLDTHFEE